MTYDKRISNNLKKLREERGLKQKFVAEKIGVSPGHYSDIENGRVAPRTVHLIALREIFGVTLDDIFFGGKIAKCDDKKDKQAI